MKKGLLFVAAISMFLANAPAAAAFYGNRDLKATPIFRSEVTPSSGNCTDSDNGLDYLTAGSVESKSGSGIFNSTDRCLSGTKLLEYTCKNDAWYANYYECEFGCNRGVCLAKEAPSDTPDTFPWDGSGAEDFLERFLGNWDTQADFEKIIQEESEGDGIEEFFSDYIEDIDFEKTDIENEEDLEEYLEGFIQETIEEDENDNAGPRSAWPDGSLIRFPGDGKVFVIKDGQKEWIETAEEFNAAGYDWKAIKDVTKDALKDIKDRIKLIKDELNKVYEVIDGKALWIPNERAFAAAGYRWEDIEDIPGDIEDFYDEVDVLEDEDGNFFHITSNGKKQLIASQSALESLTDGLLSGSEGFTSKLEAAIEKYMDKILEAAANEDAETGVGELSEEFSDEIQQIIDELVDEITQSLDASMSEDGAAFENIDWEKEIEDIFSGFGSGGASDLSDEEMEALWENFEDSDAYEDFDRFLSEQEDLFDESGDANLSSLFDLSDFFDLSSFKDIEEYLGSIEDAKLIREEGDYRVYELVDGQKQWIPSAEELAQKGYSWDDIVTVNPTLFTSYDSRH